MRSKQFIALALLATTVAFAAPRSDARSKPIHLNLGSSIGKGNSSIVAAAVGVTIGVLAIIGGAVWYVIHHRKESTTPTATAPATGAETAPQTN